MNRVSDLVEEVLRTAPGWVKPELVRETVPLFERRYKRPLTAEEIREIIVDVGRFVDVVKQVNLNESIRRTGESQQP